MYRGNYRNFFKIGNKVFTDLTKNGSGLAGWVLFLLISGLQPGTIV
jgi:hypothetical protein